MAPLDPAGKLGRTGIRWGDGPEYGRSVTAILARLTLRLCPDGLEPPRPHADPGTIVRVAARRYIPPRDWVTPDGHWPVGPFAADAPVYALVTAAIASNYRDHAGDRSLRSVARAAGIDATSLGRTLAGETVPDVHTLAVLEDALAAERWPRRHGDPEREVNR